MDVSTAQPSTPEELSEIADLYGKVFPGRSYFDFYKIRMAYQSQDPYFKPEFSRIIRVDGKIVSHVSLVEKRFWIRNTLVRVGGIADVCTHPDHRGKQFTSILMNDALKYMAEQGYALSLLNGIPNFYHRFGYVESLYRYRMTVPLKPLESLQAKKKVRPFKKKDLPIVNRLYNKAFKGRTLSVKRVEKSWFNIPLDRCCGVVPDSKDKPIAYLIGSHPLKASDPGFYLKEAVAFDPESAATLTQFVRDRIHQSYQSKLEVHQRPDSYYLEYLRDFGGTLSQDIPSEGEGGGMLRIVLLEELFRQLLESWNDRLSKQGHFPPDLQIQFKTDLGQVILEITRQGIRLGSERKKQATLLSCSQEQLVRLLVGYWRPSHFFKKIQGVRLTGQAFEILNFLFPPDTPYCGESDFF